MIGFAPPKADTSLLTRIIDTAKAAFALAQSAQDVTLAIRAAFRNQPAGTQTLTLGTTAPSYIANTVASRYVQIVESDGKVTTILGWR